MQSEPPLTSHLENAEFSPLSRLTSHPPVSPFTLNLSGLTSHISADARQLFARQHVHHPPATDTGA
jgi:hypothetical protein